MPTTTLLETLLLIERSLGRAEPSKLRALIMDAQLQLLHMEKESIRMLEELRMLRERREIHMPGMSWRAVAQALAKAEAEKEAAAAPEVVEIRANTR